MVTKGNVLVVDDEVNLCRILGAKLTKSGYSVVAVHDGQQAVEKVRESDFDLVLLDLILPKMDGLAALAEIRGISKGLPVIVMTACENPEALAQAKSFGVSAYVNKPFDLDNLVSLVSDTSTHHESNDRRLPTATVLFAKDQEVILDIVNGSLSKTYHGWIEHKDDRTLSVSVPRRDDEAGEILPRCSVKAGLAAADAYYSFSTHVLRVLDSPQRIIILDKPGVIYRLQRRQHSRYMLRIPASYCLANDENTELRMGETVDISLGGVKLIVPEEILPGELVKVELRPKTVDDVIRATAQVLRSTRNNNPGEYDYIIACRFTSSEDSLQKLLEG